MPVRFPQFRARRDAIPDKMWTRCPSCEEQLFNKHLERTLNVCPSCGHHFRLSAPVRLGQLLGQFFLEPREQGVSLPVVAAPGTAEDRDFGGAEHRLVAEPHQFAVGEKAAHRVAPAERDPLTRNRRQATPFSPTVIVTAGASAVPPWRPPFSVRT